MARHAAPEQQTQLPVPTENVGYAPTSDATDYSRRAWADLVYEPHPATEQTQPDTLERVQALRGWMQNLPDEPRRRLEGYVRQFYDDKDRPVGRHGSHIDWLADEYSGATAEDVLAWKDRQSFELHAQQHDPEVQTKIATVRERTAEKYAEYVDKGRLAKVSVLPDPVAAIKNTHVKVGDVRDTMIWGDLGYWPGDDQVVVGQGHSGTTEERTASLLREIDETLPHEFLHAARLGEFLPSWAMEGIVEHVTDAFAHGNMDVLYPEYRDKASHIYLAERRLIGTLQLFGAKEIDAGVITRAFSSSGYDSHEFQALDDQLYDSWKVRGKFHRVSTRVTNIERELTEEHPDWHPMKIQAYATQEVSEELIVQGAWIRQRVHELGKRAAGYPPYEEKRAVGRAKVPLQRSYS